MSYCSYNDLKEISKLWCEDNIRSVSEDEIYYITSNVIFDNFYIPNRKITIKYGKYIKIANDFNTNGWDEEYPAVIGINKIGKIFIYDGNHRMNIVKNLKLKKIPIKFIYLTKGRKYDSNDLLPREKINKKSVDMNWLKALYYKVFKKGKKYE